MKTAKELYPDNDYDDGDYNPILNSLGNILVRVDDEDYQGDSRVLYKDGDRFGILVFGWGSCSGCDALQACGSYANVEKLIEKLNRDLKWFDSKEETIRYIKEHDWEGDFGDKDKIEEFIKKTLEVIE